jgi:hypothetical protein
MLAGSIVSVRPQYGQNCGMVLWAEMLIIWNLVLHALHEKVAARWDNSSTSLWALSSRRVKCFEVSWDVGDRLAVSWLNLHFFSITIQKAILAPAPSLLITLLIYI